MGMGMIFREWEGMGMSTVANINSECVQRGWHGAWKATHNFGTSLSSWSLNSLLFLVKRVNFSHTRYRALGPELIPVYRQSARRWIEAIHPAVGCHCFPPGLRLPSQPKSVTAHRPVPNYTAWWQRHKRVSSLPKAVTWKRNGRNSNYTVTCTKLRVDMPT